MSGIREEIKLFTERRRFVKELRKYHFNNTQHRELQYTYQSALLIKCWLIWKVLIILVDLYLINECYLWISFQSFYQMSLTKLLPLAIILFCLLLTNIIFRIFMTPKLPNQLTSNISLKSKYLLIFEHYFRYDYNGWQIAIDVLYFISYLIPYESARYLHLVYAFKIVVMQALASDIYSQIHTIKFLRILYHLLVLFFLIIYLSHFLGCIFYVIDQSLIESQYFGDPVTNPNLYYQFSSQAFTPIQMLSELQRYVMAFYFANGLVSTIAYGDIVGKNYIEDAYVGVLMVASTILIAFLLEEFIIMLKDNSFEVFEIIKRFRHLRLAMKLKNVSTSLQLRIRNYIFYIEYYDKFKNPSQIVQKLSNKMQLDLFEQGYGNWLAPIFKPLGVGNIRIVCKYLKEVSYQPQIDIYTIQPKQKSKSLIQQSTDISISHPSFLFIIEGKAYQYLQWNSQSKQFRFRQGLKNVNFYEFFTQTRVRFALRSKYVLKCVALSHSDLVQILSEDQQSFKKLKEQKQQLLSYCTPTRSKFQDDCEICNQTDHSIFYCPSIFYVIHQNIDQAEKMSNILSEKVNPRKNRIRKQTKSAKKISTLHYSVVLQKVNFLSLFAGQQPSENEEKEDIGASLIQKMLKDIYKKTSTNLPQQSLSADCCYDQQGLDSRWAI